MLDRIQKEADRLNELVGELLQVTRVVSKDGKVETIHGKGHDADGKPISNLVIYEKQPPD